MSKNTYCNALWGCCKITIHGFGTPALLDFETPALPDSGTPGLRHSRILALPDSETPGLPGSLKALRLRWPSMNMNVNFANNVEMSEDEIELGHDRNRSLQLMWKLEMN